MGLASSQARLLLLTSRKSDLEFRAQQITNSTMILAMQTEEVAREYSLKLSNQTLKYINASDSSEIEISASTLSDLSAKNGSKMKLQVRIGGKWEDWNEDSGSTNNYTGPMILEGINAGTMRIVYAEGSDEGKEVDAINGTKFSVSYDTKDDATADAEYRRKTAALQIKEKRLQMDLTQIETQQKACETEMDSVKKIIDKSIERTFKVFS